jgi:hypothetical protein
MLPFVYVVFWMNANPWWILLGTLLALTASGPSAWGLNNKEIPTEKCDKKCNKDTCCQKKKEDQNLLLG